MTDRVTAPDPLATLSVMAEQGRVRFNAREQGDAVAPEQIDTPEKVAALEWAVFYAWLEECREWARRRGVMPPGEDCEVEWHREVGFKKGYAPDDHMHECWCCDGCICEIDVAHD